MDEMLRDHEIIMQSMENQSTNESGESSSSLQAKVSELESEVSRLKEQLGKAKGINDAMWEKFVQKAVADNKDPASSNDDIEMTEGGT